MRLDHSSGRHRYIPRCQNAEIKCVAKEGEKDFQFHMAGIDQKTQWLETWELVALAISETWGAVVYLPRLGYLMR